MNYQELANQILENVGGSKNVSHLTHCATRLRFNLKDESLAKTDVIKGLKGVMGVVSSGGQYQVIIGSDVSHVYKPIIEKCQFSNDSHDESKMKKGLGASFIDMISSIFTPILPALTAAGMLKALLALFVAFKWVNTDSQSYQIINFMSDAAFYFLPMMLASSAAKKFKCNQILAIMLAGILLHPNFVAMVNNAKETGEAIRFTFLPIYSATYSSSVIPIILTVYVMSHVERFADKISPKTIKFFTVPLIVVSVTGILSLVVLGPIGYIIGNWIAIVVKFLEKTCGWLVPMLLGGIFPLLVMTGTHYGIIPIGQNNLMTLGYDTLLGPSNLASNIAQGGAALAVSMKTKDPEIKQLASTSGITAVCGITEPALYGVNIRFKTPLYAAMAGGAFGGLFMGILGVRRFGAGSPGLMTLPVYLGGESMNNFIFAVIGSVLSFIIAFIISYILYKEPKLEVSENKEVEEVKQNVTSSEIYAPVNGKAVALSSVNDPTFAQGIMGKGGAIIPSDGHFVSPVSGVVQMVFETKHAIGIQSDDGVEVLIHVGLDTVKLNGEPFEALVKSGDHVEVGTPILNVDLEMIKDAGLDIITPVIVTNSMEYGDVLAVEQDIEAQDVFIKAVK